MALLSSAVSSPGPSMTTDAANAIMPPVRRGSTSPAFARQPPLDPGELQVETISGFTQSLACPYVLFGINQFLHSQYRYSPYSGVGRDGLPLL